MYIGYDEQKSDCDTMNYNFVYYSLKINEWKSGPINLKTICYYYLNIIYMGIMATHLYGLNGNKWHLPVLNVTILDGTIWSTLNQRYPW